MKRTVYIIIIILIAFQTSGFSQKKRDRDKVKQDTVSVDSLEYKLIVFDPGFDSWLSTRPSKNFYSNEYYAKKNWMYVMEWNQRYMTERRSSLYSNFIDYNPRTDYGIDLNYRLYYYFKYFEETNRVRLLNSGR
jgi:hypothetical protein